MLRKSTALLHSWIGLLLLVSVNLQAQTKKTVFTKAYLQAGLGSTTHNGSVGELSVQGVLKNNWTLSFNYQDFSLTPKNLPKDYIPADFVVGLFFLISPDISIPISLENRLVTYSLSGGKLFDLGRKAWLTTEAGISIAKGQKFTFQPQNIDDYILFHTSNYADSATNHTTVGGVLRADFTWAFASFAGLGVGAFANINSIQSPVGVQLKLVLGWMNRKPKVKTL